MTGRIWQPGEGTSLDAFGARLTMKATGDDSRQAFSLLEGTFVPGGFAPLPHIHRTNEETFYVVEGTFDFAIGDETFSGGPGTFVLVPRGVLHGFKNAGDSPARLLVMHTPPLDRFFVEMAELARHGPLDPRALGALMQKWDMELPRSGGPGAPPSDR